ncbi:MAG: 3-methyl-2-oxobutanoate hydroxymethyltransferase [Planctomycetota bacterium]
MTRVTVRDFGEWKSQGRKFACVTAYDAPSARIAAAAGIPLILVGDSLGNAVLGYKNTLPVTLDEMLHHAKAVRRGAPDGFVVGDLPFLSYQVSVEQALESTGRFVKEGGVDAVKLEGGRAVSESVRRIVEMGVPVMGHLGLTPQSTHRFGGFRVQGTTAAAAVELLEDAQRLADAGAFSIVIECVPERVAAAVASRVSVPVIGIGAGVGCDGQILVWNDVIGIESEVKPRFVRRYAEVEAVIRGALERFVADVGEGAFPGHEESFRMSDDEWSEFQKSL